MVAIESFKLFLFDFDGLLVDTEPLHYQAYSLALKKRGADLLWDFSLYSKLAHQNAVMIRKKLEEEFGPLVSDWDCFYEEKKEAYQLLLDQVPVDLMPGVEKLLSSLKEKKIKRCVVTHSPRAQIEKIVSKLPILQTIPYWITREDYHKPKPDPECYQKAIDLYAELSDSVIGFEDSLRGLHALQKTRALPVWICSKEHPLFNEKERVLHFSSFLETGWV